MKKILIFIDSLTCGGAEKSLISLLPFLAERDYEITLMLRARGGIFEKYVPENIRMTDFPYAPSRIQRLKFSLALRLPWNKDIHRAELYWKYIGKYYRTLDTEYDAAIAYQQGFPTYYIAEKVKAQKKICWINADLKSVHYSPEFNASYYSSYDNVVAVSSILSELLISNGFLKSGKEPTIVMDILNEELIKRLSEEKITAEEFKGFTFTTVGRLVPPKGFDLAIDAAEIIRNKVVSFRWFFVGDGPLSEELKEKVKHKNLSKEIIFTGETSNPYPFMKAADIYVQTSKNEGFGITIGEAKILHKPIVSTNFPVIHNQLTDGVNGMIVGMSGKEIADGVLRLLNNKDLQNKFMSNLQKENNTTSETESTKVISLIEEK